MGKPRMALVAREWATNFMFTARHRVHRVLKFFHQKLFTLCPQRLCVEPSESLVVGVSFKVMHQSFDALSKHWHVEINQKTDGPTA